MAHAGECIERFAANVPHIHTKTRTYTHNGYFGNAHAKFQDETIIVLN